MDSKRLVEAVGTRPILYKYNIKSYKDADKKAAAWTAVAVAAELKVHARIRAYTRAV